MNPLIAMLELTTNKKEILRLSLSNEVHLFDKLFTNKSLLFLKAEQENIRKALEIVQLFAIALGSQCNIEKSRLISLMESDRFDYARWIGEVISRGMIFRHLKALLGCYITPKQAFNWVQERIQKKMNKWRYEKYLLNQKGR